MYLYNTLWIREITVEHQRHPVGIDCRTPRFAWKLESDGENVFQQAFCMKILDETHGSVPVFDSGIMVSGQSIDIMFLFSIPEIRNSMDDMNSIHL